MRGQHLGILAVELDLLVDTDIDLREVILVEVLLQQFGLAEQAVLRQDVLLLELILGAEDKPGGMQLLVLLADGL